MTCSITSTIQLLFQFQHKVGHLWIYTIFSTTFFLHNKNRNPGLGVPTNKDCASTTIHILLWDFKSVAKIWISYFSDEKGRHIKRKSWYKWTHVMNFQNVCSTVLALFMWWDDCYFFSQQAIRFCAFVMHLCLDYRLERHAQAYLTQSAQSFKSLWPRPRQSRTFRRILRSLNDCLHWQFIWCAVKTLWEPKVTNPRIPWPRLKSEPWAV